MFLPFDVVEDVIPHTSMLQHVILGDVIASGRWNSHYRVVVEYQMVDVINKNIGSVCEKMNYYIIETGWETYIYISDQNMV